MLSLHEEPGCAGRTGSTLCERALELLACPVCAGGLVQGTGCLVCERCRVRYPITDGIPVLLAHEACPID